MSSTTITVVTAPQATASATISGVHSTFMVTPHFSQSLETAPWPDRISRASIADYRPAVQPRKRFFAAFPAFGPASVVTLARVPVAPSRGVFAQRLSGDIAQRLEYPLVRLRVERRIV